MEEARMSEDKTPFDPDDDGRAARAVRVGLMGCGNVGTPVARALLEESETIERAVGAPLELAHVAVAHPGKTRDVYLPEGIVTTDALAVAIDPEVDIVIELIGGIEPSFGAISAALGDNKAVITANKELLARRGDVLFADPGAELYFEASVCGAIPIVRTLRECCAGDEIEAISGIFNGTSNFVLSRMSERGSSLEDALTEARRLGLAEADPSADIEGFDAAAKVAILARIAFGVPVGIDDVHREGISGIDQRRVQGARLEGRVFRLVGRVRPTRHSLDLRVGPELLDRDHPLARIDGANNAVLVTARRAGTLAFHGAGAGGDPTAASVLGDLVVAARRRVGDGRALSPCAA